MPHMVSVTQKGYIIITKRNPWCSELTQTVRYLTNIFIFQLEKQLPRSMVCVGLQQGGIVHVGFAGKLKSLNMEKE